MGRFIMGSIKRSISMVMGSKFGVMGKSTTDSLVLMSSKGLGSTFIQMAIYIMGNGPII